MPIINTIIDSSITANASVRNAPRALSDQAFNVKSWQVASQIADHPRQYKSREQYIYIYIYTHTRTRECMYEKYTVARLDMRISASIASRRRFLSASPRPFDPFVSGLAPLIRP